MSCPRVMMLILQMCCSYFTSLYYEAYSLVIDEKTTNDKKNCFCDYKCMSLVNNSAFILGL